MAGEPQSVERLREYLRQLPRAPTPRLRSCANARRAPTTSV
jgi:hypothetical protein